MFATVGWMGNPVLPLLQITHVGKCGFNGEPSPSPAPDNPCLQLWGGWKTQSFPCSRQPMFATVGYTGNPVLPLLQTTHVCNCGWMGNQVLPLLQTTHVCNCGWMGNAVLPLLEITHFCNRGVYGEPSPSPASDNPCLQLWGGWGTQSFPCSRQPMFATVGYTGNPVLPLLQTTHVCNCGWMGNPVLPLLQTTHVCNCGVDGEPSPSPASDNPCLQLWVDGEPSPSPASDNPCLQLWGGWGTQSFPFFRQPMFATVGWMGNPVLPLLQTTHVCNCGWMGNPVLPLPQITHVCNCGVDGERSPSPASDNPCFSAVGRCGVDEKTSLPLLQTTHVCNCGVDGEPVLPLLQITHVGKCEFNGEPSPSPAPDNQCLQLWGGWGTHSFPCFRQPMSATVGWMGNQVLPLLQTTHVCNCGVYGEPSPSPAPDNPCLQLWGIRGTQSFPCSRQPIFLAVGWMGNPVLPLLQTTHVCNCGVYGEPSPSSVPDNPCLQLWGGWGTQSFPCSRQPMFATVG